MRTRLKFFGFFTLLLLLFWRWMEPSPWPLHSLAGPLRSGLATALFGSACLALGPALLLRFRLFTHSLSEEAVLSFGLGLGALSLAALGLGLAGALYAWVAWLTVAVLHLACFEHLEHFGHELKGSLRSKHPWEGSTSELLLVLPAVLCAAVTALLALAPVSFYDALVYHFAMPARAVETARMLPQAGNLYSWLPGMLEGGWAFCMLLGGEKSAQLLNLSIAGALALAVTDQGARLLPSRRLWLPACLLFTQPAFCYAFGVFGSDAPAAFYCFLSLSAFLSSLGGRNQRLGGNWMLLAFLLAGLAAAAKPVALLHAGALLVVLALRAATDPGERRPGLLFACAALFVAPLLPALARNFALCGNPLYPFGLKAFGFEVLEPASRAYFEHMKGYGADLPWWRVFWDLLFNPSQASLGGGGALSFLLLAGLAAAFMEHPRELRWLALHLLFGLALFAAGPRVLRYVLIFLPGAALLASFALVEAEHWARSRGWVLALRAFLALCLLAGAARYTRSVLRDFDPFKAALGLEARERYLERQGVQYLKAAQWLREKAPKSQVLVLLEARSAYLPPRARAYTVFDQNPFVRMLERASTPQELDALALEKGYDFVLINRPEGRRAAAEGTPFAYYSTPEKEALFNAWMQSHAPAGAPAQGEGVLLFPLR